MKQLAIITTHPVQYYAPVFELLHQRKQISIKVFYTWGKAALNKYDPGFDQHISWDIPLLDGYPYEWALNTATDPGTHHFKGIINPELSCQVEAWQPDAILFYGWSYQGHLKALHYFKNRVPVFFWGDSTLLDEKKGIKAIFKAIFLKWVYQHVDHAFYVGTNNKAYFKKYGLKESQLSFAPHAVDNDRFSADRADEAFLLRQQLAVKESQVLVLFAGKLEDKKSPSLLLNAFLALKNSNIHLLILGNGTLETLLREKAKGIKNISFISFKNQSLMPSVYQACDLFCLPSGGPGETWGLAVNEAMACGRAVLVSDKVGCATDLVKENYNGSIFKSGNIDDLINTLHKLTRSKQMLREYGGNGKARVRNWSFLRIAEAIESKLDETI